MTVPSETVYVVKIVADVQCYMEMQPDYGHIVYTHVNYTVQYYMYSIMWKCSLITVIWCTHNKRMLLKSWLMYNFIWKCSLTTVVWSTHMEILQYSIICTVLYGDAA